MATTVLLPLEPVTATMGPRASRENRSISPVTGTPAATASSSAGSRRSTPGLTTSSPAPSRLPARKPPSSTSMAGSSFRKLGQPRRPRAAVHHAETPAAAAEMARAGKAGVAETDDHTGGFLSGGACHHGFRASAQFQRNQPEQDQHQGDDPEAHDHPRFRPAFELEMVVQWRHAENAPAGELETRRPGS